MTARTPIATEKFWQATNFPLGIQELLLDFQQSHSVTCITEEMANPKKLR
jgi:hypothetical protein